MTEVEHTTLHKFVWTVEGQYYYIIDMSTTPPQQRPTVFTSGQIKLCSIISETCESKYTVVSSVGSYAIPILNLLYSLRNECYRDGFERTVCLPNFNLSLNVVINEIHI